MPHGYRQSNARLVWLICPYLSANYVADCPPNMAQVSVYKAERTGRCQSPWGLILQGFCGFCLFVWECQMVYFFAEIV